MAKSSKKAKTSKAKRRRPRRAAKALPQAQPALSAETNPANWSAPFSKPTVRPATPIETLISPYYLKDPDLDPRTSKLGFRSQPSSLTETQATDSFGQVSPAKLEELAVKVALLEAAITVPRPAGVGHNRGPELEAERNDEQEIRDFIARLTDAPVTSLSTAIVQELAEKEAKRADEGIQRQTEFAKGVLKGAGFAVGKKTVEQLIESAWWISVYNRLMDVARALFDLIL